MENMHVFIIHIHYMGLETPVSILLGDFMKNRDAPGVSSSICYGRSCISADLSKGTVLKVEGHHHSIKGLVPELLECVDAKEAAPFYLLNGAELLRDVKAGEMVTQNDVDLSSLETYQYYKQGLELR